MILGCRLKKQTLNLPVQISVKLNDTPIITSNMLHMVQVF